MARLRKTLAAVTTVAPLLAAAAAAPALAATSAHGGGAPTPAVPPPPGGHYVTWQNQHNGEYLHVQNASKSNSAVVNTYTGSGSCAEHGETDLQCAEEWSQASTAYSHEFVYVNINSGLCLDDGENAVTTPTQYSCGTTYPENRRWIYDAINAYSDDGVRVYDTLATPYGGGGIGRFLCTKGNGPSLYVYAEIFSAQNVAFECAWQ